MAPCARQWTGRDAEKDLKLTCLFGELPRMIPTTLTPVRELKFSARKYKWRKLNITRKGVFSSSESEQKANP